MWYAGYLASYITSFNAQFTICKLAESEMKNSDFCGVAVPKLAHVPNNSFSSVYFGSIFGSRAFEYIILALVVALGAWLRFRGLGMDSFTGDEFAYTYLDKSPVSSSHVFTHAFDYYIRCYAHLVHCFGGTLEDEFTFRFLPAMLGTAAILLLYISGRIAGWRTIGLMAAALFAVNPCAIAYSRCAIQYSHAMFGCAWLMVSVLLVTKHSRLNSWCLLVLASTYLYFIQVFCTTLVVGAWATIAVYGLATMIQQGRIGWHWLVKYGAASVVLAALCLPEYIMYIHPSLAPGGRLNFNAAQLSGLQTLHWGNVWCSLTSQFPLLRHVFLGALFVGILWGLFRMRCIIVMFLITEIVIFAMLSGMRLSFGFRERYLFFMLPLIIVIMAGGFYLAAHIVASITVNTGEFFWQTVVHHKPFGSGTKRVVRVLIAFIITIAFLAIAVLHCGDIAYLNISNALATFSNIRETVLFLKSVARPGDIILTGYDKDFIEWYQRHLGLPALPCELVQVTSAYDGNDITIQQIRGYQDKYQRVIALFASGYFRWAGGERVRWMDTEFISVPLAAYHYIHLWDRKQCDASTNTLHREEHETELLKQFLNVAPQMYLARKRLAALQASQHHYESALTMLRLLIKQYPFDPQTYALVASIYQDHLSDKSEALKMLKLSYAAASLQPDRARYDRWVALLNLMNSYYAMGRPDDVLQRIVKAKAILDKYFTEPELVSYHDSQYVEVQLLEAAALEMLDRHSDAVACYDMCLEHARSQYHDRIKARLSAAKQVLAARAAERGWDTAKRMPEIIVPMAAMQNQFSHPFPAHAQESLWLPEHTRQRLGMSNRLECSSNEPIRFIIFGDSIAASKWDILFAQRLRSLYPRASIEVLNKSVGGYSTMQLEKRIWSDVIAAYPDCVMIHTASNEAWSLDGFYRRYALLLAHVKQWCAADVVLLTPWPSSAPDGCGNNDARYYHSITELARQFKCAMIDISVPLRMGKTPIKEYLLDGVHPNNAGNERIAELIMESGVFNPAIKPTGARKIVLPARSARWWNAGVTGHVSTDDSNDAIDDGNGWVYSGKATALHVRTRLEGTRLIVAMSIPSNSSARVFCKIDGMSAAHLPGAVTIAQSPKANPANINNGSHAFNNDAERTTPLRVFAPSCVSAGQWQMHFVGSEKFVFGPCGFPEKWICQRSDTEFWYTNTSRQFVFSRDDVWWQSGLYLSNDVHTFSTDVRTVCGVAYGSGNHMIELAAGLYDSLHTVDIFIYGSALKGLRLNGFYTERTNQEDVPTEFRRARSAASATQANARRRTKAHEAATPAAMPTLVLYDLPADAINTIEENYGSAAPVFCRSVYELPWLPNDVFDTYGAVLVQQTNKPIVLQSWVDAYHYELSRKNSFTDTERALLLTKAATASDPLDALVFYLQLTNYTTMNDILRHALGQLDAGGISNGLEVINHTFGSTPEIAAWRTQMSTQTVATSLISVDNCLAARQQPSTLAAICGADSNIVLVPSRNADNFGLQIATSNLFRRFQTTVVYSGKVPIRISVMCDGHEITAGVLTATNDRPWKLDVALASSQVLKIQATSVSPAHFDGRVTMAGARLVR